MTADRKNGIANWKDGLTAACPYCKAEAGKACVAQTHELWGESGFTFGPEGAVRVLIHHTSRYEAARLGR